MKLLFGLFLLVVTCSAVAESVVWKMVSESGTIGLFPYFSLQDCMRDMPQQFKGTTCVAFVVSD
jgi:hypothetical protein